MVFSSLSVTVCNAQVRTTTMSIMVYGRIVGVTTRSVTVCDRIVKVTTVLVTVCDRIVKVTTVSVTACDACRPQSVNPCLSRSVGGGGGGTNFLPLNFNTLLQIVFHKKTKIQCFFLKTNLLFVDRYMIESRS